MRLIWYCWFKVEGTKDLHRLTDCVVGLLTNELFPKVLEGIRVWLEQSRADIMVVDDQKISKESDVSFILDLICFIYLKTNPCFCFLIQEGLFSANLF